MTVTGNSYNLFSLLGYPILLMHPSLNCKFPEAGTMSIMLITIQWLAYCLALEFILNKYLLNEYLLSIHVAHFLISISFHIFASFYLECSNHPQGQPLPIPWGSTQLSLRWKHCLSLQAKYIVLLCWKAPWVHTLYYECQLYLLTTLRSP